MYFAKNMENKLLTGFQKKKQRTGVKLAHVKERNSLKTLR